MRKPFVIGATVTFVILASGLLYLFMRPSTAPSQQSVNAPSNVNSTPSSPASSTQGRYTTYSAAAANDTSFSETILFFYAPWCPECRAFDTVLTSATIPESTQILKVDYDTATDLKQRYGVTLQTTFVKITSGGEKVSLWTAYGKEKSLQAVLSNT